MCKDKENTDKDRVCVTFNNILLTGQEQSYVTRSVMHYFLQGINNAMFFKLTVICLRVTSPKLV